MKQLDAKCRALSLIAGIVLFSQACSQTNEIPLRAQEIQLNVTENAVPGTVNKLWSEPMYNQVEIPAQLDSNGIYYRPAHNTIVEIRKDKYQKTEFPLDREMKLDLEPNAHK